MGNNGEANELFLNTGSGSFVKDTSFDGGSADTQAVAFGDVNGDQHLDIIVGNYNQANQLFLNDGSGGFGSSSNLPTGGTGEFNTKALAFGDVDGDASRSVPRT